MVREFAHRPVLLEESIAQLNLRPGAVIVDGTIGGAGHAEAILHETRPGGVLIGLDLDTEALEAARQRLAEVADRVRLVEASFRDLAQVLAALGVERVDGVLFDLGVSSHQLDAPERGFRFSGSESEVAATPLDMRLNPGSGETAAGWLWRATASELQTCFQDYGELPGSKRLAHAIVEARQEAPIETAADLLRVIQSAHVGGGRKHHPATRVFQALRIAVNDEMGALREGLDAAVETVRPGGRIVVIAYHSIEDRVVKQHFRAGARGCVCPPRLPVCVCGKQVTLRSLTKKPVGPSRAEVEANPRARSARLRAVERVEVAA